jgi:PAS domain S-box-containing protein
LVSIDGKWLKVNSNVCKILGYSEEELLKKTFQDITHPDDLDLDLKLVKQLLNGEIETYTMEKRYFHKDGQIVWVFLAVSLVKDIHGVPIHFISQLEDISDRKKSQEELNRRESVYSKLVANIGDVIAIIDGNGINKYKSPNIEKWFGWKPEELVGLSTWNNVHPEDLEPAQRFLGALMSEPNSIGTTQLRYLCKDKSYKWIEFTGINLLNDPDIQGLLGNYHDITDRKKAEEVLKNSENRYRMLFERSNDAIFIVETETGRYLDANKAAENITGKSLDELKSLKTHEITPKGSKKRLEKIMNTTKPMEMGEVEYVRPDGTSRTALLNTIPLSSGQAYGIARDISERKKAEADIKLKNEELIRANADKDRFMSILAHDLKSPFSSILGFLELLNENIYTYDINKIANIIKLVDKAAHNTYNLLEDLLLWVRSQSGKIPFEPQELNFQTLCNDVVAILEQNAKAKELSVKSIIDDQLFVFADNDMLKTVLRNLVSNAIKFTNKGGNIEIKASKSVVFTTISVKDDGVGIRPEVLEKLFDVAQAHSTSGTANETGTGLGLFICKDFIEKHKGKIVVESKLCKGSSFTISLPV